MISRKNCNSKSTNFEILNISASLPFVSVVIPHRGNDSDLENCVQAIRQQSYPLLAFELIVVLNEPIFRSLKFDLKEGEKLFWQPKDGSYAARNLGIKHAKGEIIALTDSDTLAEQDWILEAVKCLESGNQLVAGSINLSHSSPPSASTLFEKLFAFDQEKNVRFGQSVTANLIVKREIFEKYGYFNQRAKSGEDFEWTRAATSRGAMLAYCEKAVVNHRTRENWQELFQKAFRTTWHLPKGPSGVATLRRVTRRAKQQLLFGPSASRRKKMKWQHIVIAYLVRFCLFSFKSLLLIAVFVNVSWKLMRRTFSSRM